MAEGHAVIRWARSLRPLVGQKIEHVDITKRFAERARALPGERVRAVDTHGKHLLIRLSSDWTLHTHGMMFGSWQVGPVGMELRKEPKHVRLRLRTREREAVFFHGPIVELLTAEEVAGHDRLTALGPDLMQDHFDPEEVYRRLLLTRGRPIGDVVLDQTVVAGIGNIFKSEGLFVTAIDPRRCAASLQRSEADELWAATAELMAMNLEHHGPVTTLPEELRADRRRNWVYRRARRPCLRCGDPIEWIRQGDFGRMTFFCSGCQL